jgi:tetraacyldisaccharide 4'-kinase
MAARILAPAGLVWSAVAARRMAREGRDCGVPVICVGNFVVGGAGKTPVVVAIAEILTGAGARPFILSRGHGGAGHAEPVLVDPLAHSAADVGDEPLLLCKAAPTIVCSDRAAGARGAVKLGATAIVMDDGMQNPSPRKSLVVAVVDAATGIGNGLCPPAGPLRAPMAAQWPAVDALVTMGAGAPGDAMTDRARAMGKPVFSARLRANEADAAALRGQRVLAFAGIGRPEKFFASLDEAGALVVGRRSFGDHHVFSSRERDSLAREARRLGAGLVTTEKDAARLPPGFATRILRVRAEFHETGRLASLLADATGPGRA